MRHVRRPITRAEAAPGKIAHPPRSGAAPISEHQLQRAVADYLDRALPEDAFWTSIDSAGRGPIQGARMKRRGVKRGLLDALIIWRDVTIWLELKSGKGRVTPEQAAFMRIALDAGHFATLCRSVDAVADALRFYGVPLRARIVA
jgi:hypothetical protein